MSEKLAPDYSALDRRNLPILALERERVARNLGAGLHAAGLLLAFQLGEEHVFRAAVLSIVLAFAAAPEATLLCTLWCPGESSATDCHHHRQTSTSVVAATDACDAVDANVVAVTRDDNRRAAAGFGTGHLIPANQYQIVPPTHAVRTVERWAREHALEKRPLEMTLRL